MGAIVDQFTGVFSARCMVGVVLGICKPDDLDVHVQGDSQERIG